MGVLVLGALYYPPPAKKKGDRSAVAQSLLKGLCRRFPGRDKAARQLGERSFMNKPDNIGSGSTATVSANGLLSRRCLERLLYTTPRQAPWQQRIGPFLFLNLQRLSRAISDPSEVTLGPAPAQIATEFP